MRVAPDQPVTAFAHALRDVLQPWSAPLRCALAVLLWFALVQLVGAAPSVNPVFRFYNQETGTHFYTIVATERDRVIGSYPQFIYEGPAFAALRASRCRRAAGLSLLQHDDRHPLLHQLDDRARPRHRDMAAIRLRGHGVLRDAGRGQRRPHRIFRFFNTKTGAHFYTTSTTERDKVLATHAAVRLRGRGVLRVQRRQSLPCRRSWSRRRTAFASCSRRRSARRRRRSRASTRSACRPYLEEQFAQAAKRLSGCATTTTCRSTNPTTARSARRAQGPAYACAHQPADAVQAAQPVLRQCARRSPTSCGSASPGRCRSSSSSRR